MNRYRLDEFQGDCKHFLGYTCNDLHNRSVHTPWFTISGPIFALGSVVRLLFPSLVANRALTIISAYPTRSLGNEGSGKRGCDLD